MYRGNSGARSFLVSPELLELLELLLSVVLLDERCMAGRDASSTGLD